MKVKYDINKVQLKMLQITSRHAEQEVTVHCRNIAFNKNDLVFHSMKSGSSIMPRTYSDGCSVSHKLTINFLSHSDISFIIDGIFS